jgi:hypothetical protein
MNQFKNWIKKREPKTFAFGLLLLVLSVLTLAGWLYRGFETYYITGFVLFLFFGFAMIRKSGKM